MTLHAKVNSLDEISEEIQSHYKGLEDGTFQLDVAPVGGVALEDVAGLKSAYGKEQERRRKAEDVSKEYGDISPEQAREAVIQIEKMKDWTPQEEIEERIKSRETQLIKKHDQEVVSLRDREKALVGQLEKHLVESRARAALSKHTQSVDLMLPHVLRNLRMREDEVGQFVVDVIDKEGSPRIGKIAEGKTLPMTIEEFVEEMKNDSSYARGFDGTGSSGSGAQGGNVPRKYSSTEKNPFSKEHFNLTQQGKLKREHPAEYERLKQEAGV